MSPKQVVLSYIWLIASELKHKDGGNKTNVKENNKQGFYEQNNNSESKKQPR